MYGKYLYELDSMGADTSLTLVQWLGQGSNHLTLQHMCKDRDTGYVRPSFQSP